MSRRLVFSLAFFSLGLLVGVLVSRYLMPDRYGLVTMALLMLGGLVTGILLARALPRFSGARGTPSLTADDNPVLGTTQPPSTASHTRALRLKLGGSNLAVRYEPRWLELRREAVGVSGRTDSLLVACLAAALGFALYAQFTFRDLESSTRGLIAYAVAAVCFGYLVLVADVPEPTHAPKSVRTAFSIVQSRWRLILIVGACGAALIATYVGATTPWNVPQTENILLWVAGMALFAAAFVPWSGIAASVRPMQTAGARPLLDWLKRNWLELALVTAILAVAFVVRYWHLAFIPRIFGGDEGEMGSEALSILRGDLKNPFITGWLSHPTLFFFTQALSIELIAPTVFGLRALSVAAGTASVLVGYLLIRRLFTIRLALLTAALLAVYGFHIQFSRIALNNIFDALFAPLVLLLLYAGLESRRPYYFAASGMALGLAIYFYHGARLIPLILIAFGLYLLITQPALVFDNALNLVWLGLGSLVVAGPLLYFFYLHPLDFMARLTQRGIFNSGWFQAQVENGRAPIAVFLEQVRRSFLAFNQFPDPSFWYRTEQPLLDPVSAILFVFGLVYAVLNLLKKNYALLVIWLVLGIFFGSTILENPPTSPSFIIVTLPALFFVALGLDKLLFLAGRVLKPLARWRYALAGVFVALFAAWSLYSYFLVFTPAYSYGGDPNWIAADLADYVRQRTDRYQVYFFGAPYMYLGIGSLKYLAPNLKGQDVIDPVATPQDLDFVKGARTGIFAFVPGRVNELAQVMKKFPGGARHDYAKPDGQPLLTIYEVRTP